MSVREEIEDKRPRLQELCQKLGVPGLRVRIAADRWNQVTFIGNIDISRLDGYADRFFDLEEGLLKIFHRRVDLIDEEVAQRLEREGSYRFGIPLEAVELLHAS